MVATNASSSAGGRVAVFTIRRPMPIRMFFFEVAIAWPTLCFTGVRGVPGLFERLERRRLLELHPDDSDDDQHEAEQEGHAPQPAEQHVAGARPSRAKVPAPSRVPIWMPTNGSEAKKPGAWREQLRDQHGRAGLLGARAQALEDAQRHQPDGAPDASHVVGRQQADQDEPPIRAMEMIRMILRPSLSPRWPKTMPPIGRAAKPTA